MEELRPSDHQVSHLNRQNTAPIKTEMISDTCRSERFFHQRASVTPQILSYWITTRVCHLGRQQVDLHDVKSSHTRHSDSYDLLQQEEQTGDHKPLPEVCTVHHEQRPHPHVGQVRPVKHLQDKQGSIQVFSQRKQEHVIMSDVTLCCCRTEPRSSRTTRPV